MGLHIYSGSLVRFFTNDWENEIQRMAREKGFEYQARYPDGEPEWPTRGKASEHVAWMRSTIEAGLDATSEKLSWHNDPSEYLTIKLHVEAREALLVVAAHLRRPELPMPKQMPPSLDDDVAFAEAGKKGYLVEAIAPFEASLFIPGTFSRVSFMQDPLGSERLTCSTERLRLALENLKHQYWQDRTTPAEWLERGLVYARGAGSKAANGDWVAEQEPPDSLRGNAEFAFAVYSKLLQFSDRHHAPIITTW
jgi:hypothetical protein